MASANRFDSTAAYDTQDMKDKLSGVQLSLERDSGVPDSSDCSNWRDVFDKFGCFPPGSGQVAEDSLFSAEKFADLSSKLVNRHSLIDFPLPPSTYNSPPYKNKRNEGKANRILLVR